MMSEIVEAATALGKLIAQDTRAKNMASARNALQASETDCKLLEDYEKQQRKIAELEQLGKPIEPDDKRELVSLHEKVIASDIIKNLMQAQTEYVELMTSVSTAVEKEALGT